MKAAGFPTPRVLRWLFVAILAVFTILCLARRSASVAIIPRGSRYHGPSGTTSVLSGGIASVLGGKGEMLNHVVLLQFKEHATPMAVSRVTTEFLELKLYCLHPRTGKPYIKGIMGGRDHSPEGLQKGLTHVFMLEFDSVEDRNYYVEEDPVHKEFKARLRTVLQDVIVVDFTSGKFL